MCVKEYFYKTLTVYFVCFLCLFAWCKICVSCVIYVSRPDLHWGCCWNSNGAGVQKELLTKFLKNRFKIFSQYLWVFWGRWQAGNIDSGEQVSSEGWPMACSTQTYLSTLPLDFSTSQLYSLKHTSVPLYLSTKGSHPLPNQMFFYTLCKRQLTPPHPPWFYTIMLWIFRHKF